jgi:TolA-binding protein
LPEVEAVTLDNSIYKFVGLSTLVLFTFIGCGAQQKKPLDPRFDQGRKLLSTGDYKQSMKSLQSYLDAKPDGGLASRASFLIAKNHMGLGQSEDAAKQFKLTIKKYAKSDEAHKSKYKLAMLSFLNGDHDDARKQFQELVDKPTGTLVPESAAMLRYLDKLKPAGDH